MRKLLSISLFILLGFSAVAGNYKSFKVSVYTRAYEVEKMKDLAWLDSTWNIISSQAKIDKIYLETHRDLLIVPGETLEKAKKFFHDHGVETGGGITYTINEGNNFETFCYSNPEHRKKVQEIAEHTAKYFDDFILDDFFFTSCKSDIEIEAKGDKSWTKYRDELMAEAGKNLVVNAAKKVNPKVKVIIKYPNWYDHFQGLGFDLSAGPKIFDGIWSGTETRDPSSAQHLQNYLSYNIIRYFQNISQNRNLGGWVDSGGVGMGMDRYVEQIWLTMFAKAPEIALFDYSQLLSVSIRDSFKTPWQDKGESSFNWNEMKKAVKLANGKTVDQFTIARPAGLSLETIDKFVYKLGKPIGIKNYKPFNSLGEDFLQNYLGMIGLPMDMYSEFPTDQKVVLLTAQAAYDPDLISKIKAQLKKGGDIVITTGLLKAIPGKIAEIAEVTCGDPVIVNDFGQGDLTKDILIPKVLYHTNDAWETSSAGRPLRKGVSGHPMVLRALYSKGNLYVITIPDDFGNLYDLPESVLNNFRSILTADLDLRIEGPAKVGLFAYDNGTFIVESFLDEPVTIRVLLKNGKETIQDIVSGETISKSANAGGFGFGMFRGGGVPTNNFSVTIPPHSYRAFEMK